MLGSATDALYASGLQHDRSDDLLVALSVYHEVKQAAPLNHRHGIRQRRLRSELGDRQPLLAIRCRHSDQLARLVRLPLTLARFKAALILAA